jgi:hypothetical protein
MRQLLPKRMQAAHQLLHFGFVISLCLGAGKTSLKGHETMVKNESDLRAPEKAQGETRRLQRMVREIGW